MKAVRPVSRVLVAAAILWLVWGAWRPRVADVPQDLTEVAMPEALRALAPGTAFLVKGRAYPLEEGTRREWQGRFAFVHRMKRDHGGGGSSKTIRIETLEEHRPPLRFDWAGERWVLPAESYSLERASPVKPRFWPRKWLWMTRVDDWDRSSSGVAEGETVWARGIVDPAGGARVEEIWGDPWEPILAREAARIGMRRWLILAAKIAGSVLALVVLAPLWKGTRIEIRTSSVT